MGLSILEYVLQQLRDAGFAADVAYPGQKYPPITDTVAAVHIEKVDRANMAVTVEVTVITPAAQGGTACEIKALQATEVLRWAGAKCIQNGCAYDGMAQVYCVDVLATFNCVTDAQDCAMGPGFTVSVDGQELEYITGFTVEECREVEMNYEVGDKYPVGITAGKHKWLLTIQERIPAGSPESSYPDFAGKVSLVKRNGETENYRNCIFTSMHRENTTAGLIRTWKATATQRTVSMSGENIV